MKGIFIFLINFLFLWHVRRIHSQSVQTINVLFINEESNQVGQKALETALVYISKTPSLGIKVEIQKIMANRTDSEGLLDAICSIYNEWIDADTPPHLILDFTMAGMASETVKSFTNALSLPTVSASYGQIDDLRQWRDLNENQKQYLIQVMPPADVLTEIVRSITDTQQIANAAILFDENYVMDHKYKALLQNIPCRHIINEIDEPAKVKAQIEYLVSLDLKNFFILASLANIRIVLDAANQLGYFGRLYGWWVITEDKDEFKCSCKNATVVFMKPMPDAKNQDRLGQIRTSFSLNAEPEIAAAFYFDLALRSFLSIKDMITDGNWPKNITYMKCDDYDGNNSPERTGLDLLKYMQKNFSEPDTYGYINITENGVSHMDFSVSINSISIRDGSLEKSVALGSWKAGFEVPIVIEKGLENLSNFTAHPIYRVVTVEQKPFVYKLPNGQFEGYAIDLLNEISKLLNFDYTIYEAPGGIFGIMDEDGNWNGLVRELIDNRADIGAGSISVMAEREDVIDFTAPYYDLVGYSIAMRTPEQTKSLFKFLTVLENEVWLCILGAYFFTSLLVWVFDRYSPYSYQNNKEKYKDCDEKRLFDMKESFWFSMTSLTPQGGGEAPKNLSGRLIAATWWLFGFIIIASYTANLAAFLTVSRLEQPVDSLDDLSRQFKVAYAPINNSSPMRYFQRMANIEKRFFNVWKEMTLNDSLNAVERAKFAVWDYPISDKYSKMWKQMQEVGLPPNLDVALERILASKTAGDGFALIADATDVRYLQLTQCKVMMVGEEFSKKPYAFALRQNSPLKDQFNSVILTLLNKRQLERYKERWWTSNPHQKKNCPKIEDASDGISIENIGGVFIVIFLGILVACATLAFEYYFYKNRKETKIQDLKKELAKYNNTGENDNSMNPKEAFKPKFIQVPGSDDPNDKLRSRF